MALQNSRVAEVADALSAMSNKIADLNADLVRLLALNSSVAIDWGAASTPAYITEEANGNLSGRTFTRQEVANAIGSMAQLRNLLTNQAASQGDHLGNLNLLARPQ